MGTGGVGPRGVLVGRRAVGVVAAWARDRDVGEGGARCGVVLGVWGGRLGVLSRWLVLVRPAMGWPRGFLPAPGGAPWLPC